MFKIIVILGILGSVISNSYAYNSKKCKKDVFSEMHLDSFPGNFMLSSTQFTSSWGGCSLIANDDKQRKIFLANSYKPFMIDISRGNGDFANAYAELSGCRGNSRDFYIDELKRNFILIFDENPNPESIYINIETILVLIDLSWKCAVQVKILEPT